MSTQISPRTIIEALLPFEGAASLGIIYDTANRLQVEDQPVRLALRRLISAGDITQYGRGRNGSIELTDAGRARLERERIGLRLAFAQDAGQAPWDGNWHLLALSAPESERAVRDTFRREMHMLGAVSISTGLYLTPHALAALLAPELDSYLVVASVTTLSVRGITENAAIAEAQWPARDSIALYETMEPILGADDRDRDPVARQLILAESLDAALREDPLIPLELRPTPWPPTQVRRRWMTQWHEATVAAPELHAYQGWLDLAE
ncbi:PaaX family transcriptional regulator [Microbacterium sp. NPDC058269]|uniref:PaaX family transcriptional regulator n=1 Tax=Microbacterium sp. NPDC058269 TaxID=3346414 RepID=UPI0036DE4384